MDLTPRLDAYAEGEETVASAACPHRQSSD